MRRLICNEKAVSDTACPEREIKSPRKADKPEISTGHQQPNYRGKIMENKDIQITLQYNLDEINHLLTLLGALPFSQSSALINNIQMQAMPQLPRVAEENQDQAEQQ
jgi:hypothetical protein